MQNQDKNNQIIIYNTKDGQTKTVENISFHLKNIFESSELIEKSTSKDYLVVQLSGISG